MIERRYSGDYELEMQLVYSVDGSGDNSLLLL